MITWVVVWAFIRQHFMAILIGLAVLSLVGYIGSLKVSNHFLRKEVGELQLQISTLRDRESKLETANAAITTKYKGLDGKYSKLQTDNLKTLKEKIANEKELSAIKLSVNAVSLFNASKGDSNGQNSSTTVTGNDGRTRALEKTLADLLIVSAENDTNHLICIDNLKKWQGFWRDYSSVIVSINNDKQVKK